MTATPFISRQVHQWPAGVLPKENGNTSNRIPINAHYNPQHLSSISLPVLPVCNQNLLSTKTKRFTFVLFKQTYGFQYSVPLTARHSHRDLDSARSFRPIVLPNGTILIRLRDGIRLVICLRSKRSAVLIFSIFCSVEMTMNKAVRVTNMKSRIVISLESSANSAALIHPNGRVYQYGSRVEIVAYDGMHNNRFM